MRHVLTVLLALAAGMAAADVKLPSGKVQDCYCTDRNGGRVELGEVICLHVDGRMFTARCEMALNNPFWREIGEGCASSRRQSYPGDAPRRPG